MKVKELIELLSEFNPESLVILSKDGEGNSFSPLTDLGDGVYVADSTWSGFVFNDLAECLEECDDTPVGCVVFWPVN